MSEISVQFKNQLNGYNKSEVDMLLKKLIMQQDLLNY